jgi:hypothetical protein
MSLKEQLEQLLGVGPPPSQPVRLAKWAPARPKYAQEYRINVTRLEHGYLRVAAKSEKDARDSMDYEDIDWFDSDDLHIDDVEAVGADNQEDLDHWDLTFGDNFDTDGQPMCSECNTCTNNSADLTTHEVTKHWYCVDCLPSFI